MDVEENQMLWLWIIYFTLRFFLEFITVTVKESGGHAAQGHKLNLNPGHEGLSQNGKSTLSPVFFLFDR